MVPLSEICPSPENEKLYRPVRADDPDIMTLARSIKEHGVKDPLAITLDGFILSGHRRYAAAELAGLERVPCLYEDFRRSDDPDRFLRLLRECNRQREKTFDEKVHEEVVTMNPDDAYASLIEHRIRRSEVNAQTITLRDRQERDQISDAKRPFLNAILKLLDEFKDYLPVSERFIHYHLLDNPPLVHASKPDSTYRNESRFSKSLSDLVTRARVARLIPMGAICDDTRPVVTWDCHADVREFIASQLDRFLKGYFRNLMQSQPNHIELVCEKNTAHKILEAVAGKFCIPLTTGRGYSSLPPRAKMLARFKVSGKNKLVIIFASDFDPDGEVIAESFCRSLRDDFAVETIVPVRAALTLAQIQRFRPPSSIDPKKTSANYKAFAAKYGANQTAFELEALNPSDLQAVVTEAIDSVIDVDAFNRELEREKQDATSLEGLRLVVSDSLKRCQGLGGDAWPTRRC